MAELWGFFSENLIFYGSTLKILTLAFCPKFFYWYLYVQGCPKNFLAKSKWKIFHQKSKLKISKNSEKPLGLWYTSGIGLPWKVFPEIYMYIGSPKKIMGQKPNANFFTVAPYFKVTPQMGVLTNGQNEAFGSTLKIFSWALVPHLFPDIYIYLVSHRRIMSQKPN